MSSSSPPAERAIEEARNQSVAKDAVIRSGEAQYIHRIHYQPLSLLTARAVADRVNLHLPALAVPRSVPSSSASSQSPSQSPNDAASSEHRRWLLLNALHALPYEDFDEASFERVRKNAVQLGLGDLFNEELTRRASWLPTSIDSEMAWRLGTYEESSTPDDAGGAPSIRDLSRSLLASLR